MCDRQISVRVKGKVYKAVVSATDMSCERRDEEYVGKRVMRIDNMERRRRKGRPKGNWMDSVNVDLGRRDCRVSRCKTGLYGGKLSNKFTPHRSGKRCRRRRNKQLLSSLRCLQMTANTTQ